MVVLKKIIRLFFSIFLIALAFGLTLAKQTIIESINNDWVYHNSSYIVTVLQVILIVVAVINIITIFKHTKDSNSGSKFSHLNKSMKGTTLLASVQQNFNHKQKRVLDKLNNLYKK